jgi:hypothetical protein
MVVPSRRQKPNAEMGGVCRMQKVLGLQFRGAPVELGERVLENFGKRLKEWMERREVGLVDIAQNLGISYSYAAFLGKVKPYGRLLSPRERCRPRRIPQNRLQTKSFQQWVKSTPTLQRKSR